MQAYPVNINFREIKVSTARMIMPRIECGAMPHSNLAVSNKRYEV
jgi:hypothetical protein